MAELIAQGAKADQRWRRALPAGQTFVIGRSGTWATPWDDHISRQHVQVKYRDGQLRVDRLPMATNPVYFRGGQRDSFKVSPGEQFVIGETRFTLAVEQIMVSDQLPKPRHQQAFSPQFLRQVRFRDADQRIDVLSRLPELIRNASSDSELAVRLVNVLLSGIPLASAAAVVAVDSLEQEDAEVQVLHWDRRGDAEGEFHPSRRLILEALRDGESLLHSWQGDTATQFTMTDEVDWAFCTPLGGRAHGDWAIYIAGRSASRNEVLDVAAADADTADMDQDGPDLRDDLKFVELVASFLSALRESRQLERRQTSLGQFFSPVVLEALRDDDPDEVLAPREAEVAVLFCDLRGFARHAEESADDLLGLLERVSKALGVTTRHILDQGGVVGDFQGDAVMGFWGWPLPSDDLVERATSAALGIRAEFAAAANRPGHPLADFRVGIGIATGPAVAGKIGTTDQVKVTVFGPVVNLASRLEGMTKLLRAPILIDEATASRVRDVNSAAARVRRLAHVRPFGLNASVEVSELLPPAEEYPELSDAHIADYEAALDALQDRQWDQAFELLHKVPSGDRAKDFLTVFIAQHNRTPPPNWDGVIPLDSK